MKKMDKECSFVQLKFKPLSSLAAFYDVQTS